MRAKSILGNSILLTALLCASLLRADDAASIQKKLTDRFPLTKSTADLSDIVTPGAVLILRKDGLVMYTTAIAAPAQNFYKDGRIQRNEMKDRMNVLKHRFKVGNTDLADINNLPQRKFVAGEKFWVTGIDMQPDGAVFSFFSDPFDQVRYYGELKFPYPKNSPPPADDMLKTVEEVITIQAGENAGSGSAGGSQQSPPPPAPAATPTAPIAPIPPPPPPSDQPEPKTIAKGQTKDEVIAIWGQPNKRVTLPDKEIYVYPDMKVIFIGGKVSDVQ